MNVYTDHTLENRRKAEILLDYVSSERRWFTSNDNPDRSKAARMIINDMIQGNLVWAEIPESTQFKEDQGEISTTVLNENDSNTSNNDSTDDINDNHSGNKN